MSYMYTVGRRVPGTQLGVKALEKPIELQINFEYTRG